MKISIVTPSYNQGRFIERTLRSVAGQGAQDVEHVVFDGGSKDDTCAVLERWSDRVRWVSEPDRGQTHAVNKGLAATGGEIIGWLNSDDVYYPGALAAVRAFFAAHDDIDVVYGQADHIDVDDRVIDSYPTEPFDLERLKETCFVCQPALFFRRRVVVQHGMLDESLNFCMDYEYWLRLAKGGARFAHLERRLAGSRLYAETKTLGQRVKVHAEINDMLRRTFGEVPDRWLFNHAHMVVEQRIDRQEQPNRFVIEVSIRSLLNAMRWNRRVSPQMRKTVGQWIAGA